MGVVMKNAFIALLSGLIFGAGLALSGMADPHRVRSFLNIFGDWDPTLAFVMGGAIIVMALAWLIQKRITKPFATDSFLLTSTNNIDPKLIGGASIFGMGWGLAGLCPGPAFAALVINPIEALIFAISLFAGMAAYALISHFRIGS